MPNIHTHQAKSDVQEGPMGIFQVDIACVLLHHTERGKILSILPLMYYVRHICFIILFSLVFLLLFLLLSVLNVRTTCSWLLVFGLWVKYVNISHHLN